MRLSVIVHPHTLLPLVAPFKAVCVDAVRCVALRCAVCVRLPLSSRRGKRRAGMITEQWHRERGLFYSAVQVWSCVCVFVFSIQVFAAVPLWLLTLMLGIVPSCCRSPGLRRRCGLYQSDRPKTLKSWYFNHTWGVIYGLARTHLQIADTLVSQPVYFFSTLRKKPLVYSPCSGKDTYGKSLSHFHETCTTF